MQKLDVPNVLLNDGQSACEYQNLDKMRPEAWTISVPMSPWLIRRFEGFAGVYVTDTDGNDLDPDDLPNYKAPDGGADCIIYVSPEDYTPRGFQSMCTQVRNILANGDF